MKKLLYVIIPVVILCVCLVPFYNIFFGSYISEEDAFGEDDNKDITLPYILTEEDIQRECNFFAEWKWSDSERANPKLITDEGDTVLGCYGMRDCYREVDTIVNYWAIYGIKHGK